MLCAAGAIALAAAAWTPEASIEAQVPSASSGDWPQWRGPDRDGRSAETGLLAEWPSSGPPLEWSATGLGSGYGSVSTSRDRVFVQGTVGRQSVVFSLDRGNGRQVWQTPLGPTAQNDQGPGPRGTPTVDGDRVYVLTENGDLACLRFDDGDVVWHRNILREFGGRNISWLMSHSPLVDGHAVIVTPGGRNAGMVALDKMTGATIWTSEDLSDASGYASPIVADVQGVRTYVTLTASAGVGVRASDGRLMWRYRRVANGTANITTPIVFEDKVFYTSAYGTGAALLGLSATGGEVSAGEIYFTRNMQNHHGGVVLVDGYLYGFNNSILTALVFETGDRVWRDRSVGKGSVTYADGHLYILGENNVVGLAEASPDGYREKGRFRIDDQGWPSWAHPVVSRGQLLIRNQGMLSAYGIRAR
jgi:outer membrane protein assembly factor BamB